LAERKIPDLGAEQRLIGVDRGPGFGIPVEGNLRLLLQSGKNPASGNLIAAEPDLPDLGVV